MQSKSRAGSRIRPAGTPIFDQLLREMNQPSEPAPAERSPVDRPADHSAPPGSEGSKVTDCSVCGDPLKDHSDDQFKKCGEENDRQRQENNGQQDGP